jgi:hypothetical protein
MWNPYHFTLYVGQPQRFCTRPGFPAAVAQALIGDDSEAMHELYVSVGRDALQKTAAALPEI